MSSKYLLLSSAEYVTVLCTHRPSLLPIGCTGKVYLFNFVLVRLTIVFRGRKSRNTDSVGEPVDGLGISVLIIFIDLCAFAG